jgi:hypothetical protein
MFLNIHVKPAADLSRLEEVLVVTQKQVREPVVETSGSRVRAADILAQRLPSVPDKPVVVSGAPGSNAAGASGAHNTAAATQSPSGDVRKKTVQNPTPGGAGAKVELRPAVESDRSSAVVAGAASNGHSNGTSGNTSATFPAKPATASTKPLSPQSTPQPPATEDVPH